MKKFTIPLLELTLKIYVGKNEWNKWVKESYLSGLKKELLKDDENIAPDEDIGRCYAGAIWVGSINKSLIFHELSHYLDNVYNHVVCNTEDELKAHVFSWVVLNVNKWIDKEIGNAK